jgi:hypothetical protein
MNQAQAVREATAKEERSKADWRPEATAPTETVVLVCVKKGKERCPGRPDMYVAPAIKTSGYGWTLFGFPQGINRPGEEVVLWMPLPELPEGATEADKHHRDHVHPSMPDGDGR